MLYSLVACTHYDLLGSESFRPEREHLETRDGVLDNLG